MSQNEASLKLGFLTPRQFGVLVVFVGICWISPDSVLIRLAEREQSGRGCTVFYKYVFKVIATWLGFLVVYGGPKELFARMKEGGWHFIAAGVLEGCAEAGFNFGVSLTTAANNLVFLNTNPLWCAILGFVLFRERPPVHTIVTLFLGFSCIILVFLGTGSDTPSGRESVGGDILALCTGLVLAVYLTVCRHAGKVKPNATLVPASALGSLITLCIGAAAAEGNVGEACAPKSGLIGYLPSLINGAVVIPIALATFAIGPKYILGSEAGLIMLLEIILGPLFVWIALGEVPSMWCFIGGGLLVLFLAIHEIISLRIERQTAARELGLKDSSKPAEDSESAISTVCPDEDNKPVAATETTRAVACVTSSTDVRCTIISI